MSRKQFRVPTAGGDSQLPKYRQEVSDAQKAIRKWSVNSKLKETLAEFRRRVKENGKGETG